MKTFFIILFVLLSQLLNAQNKLTNGLQLNLNDSGSNYIKVTFLNQVWARYNWNNPGSSVYNIPQKETFDVGLRRTRFQLIAQLTDRVLFYSQFGINNFNYLSARKSGAFFHDVLCEYAIVKSVLHIGGGLNAWSGPGRYSAPAAASIMGIDAPLFEQTTNDVSDQFLRKLSVYAKGKIGKFDYRLAVAKPLAMQNSALYQAAPTKYSDFSSMPPSLQYQGYISYQFFEKEANALPYMAGTYLGKKKVLSVGVGNVFQQNALWNKNKTGDTVFSNLNLIAADIFAEFPLSKEKKNAVNFYSSYFLNKMGNGYLRSVGPMAPTNTLTGIPNSVNGTGSAFPMIGAGHTFYFQGGYLFKENLLKTYGTLMPYALSQISWFDRLNSPVKMYELGVNWFIKGHLTKITLAYQSRPIFQYNSFGIGNEIKSSRRGLLLMQYQIAF